MPRRAAWLLTAALLFTGSSVHAAEPPLVLERTIALPSVAGRIDHLAVDIERRRLFVAELGNNTVDVVDLTTGSVVRRLDGLKEPQGVGYSAAAETLAVANAGDGSVRLFRGADLTPAGGVALGDDADNVRIHPRSGVFVVGYGSGGLAMIDPAQGTVVGRVALPAHPEGFQLTSDGGRALVNVPDTHEVAVVDLLAGRRTADWKLPNLKANFPMALDPEGRVVAIVTRSPPRLVLLDAASGGLLSAIPGCGDADDVFFDARRRRIYASCGDGHVDVWQRLSGGIERVALVATSPGARTSLFVPALDHLFVAARAPAPGFGRPASILVFRPAD